MIFEEWTDRERHVQRISKLAAGAHLVLDFLLAEASLRDFLDGANRVDLPEGPLVFVSRENLIRMKRQAGRAQDLADIEKLESPDV